LKGDLLFPAQHSLAVLQAAMEGQTRLQADLYDGSEKGLKIYETTTAIGGELGPGANNDLPNVKNAEQLNNVRSWPVVISYYDQTQRKDGAAAYEVSYRLYANGVSRKLKLDYGNFALAGELSSLDFLTAKPCGKSTALKRIRDVK
jgi:hypothetical protein